MERIKVPDADLSSLIFYSNVFVFSFAAFLGIIGRLLMPNEAIISKSNRYQSSNSHKVSEIEFEFMSNDEITHSDLEKSTKKQIKTTLKNVLKKNSNTEKMI
jgi:hypothetical protein